MKARRVSSYRKSNPGFVGLCGVLGDLDALKLEVNRHVEAEQLGLKWAASPELCDFIHLRRLRDGT